MITFLYLYFFVNFGLWLLRTIPVVIKKFPAWWKLTKAVMLMKVDAIKAQKESEALKKEVLTIENFNQLQDTIVTLEIQVKSWQDKYFALLNSGKQPVMPLGADGSKSSLGAK